ncbi:MAG: hypothetical protein COA94_07310 [Rickettsiales bacterium]|nr:MAG: hypothetical protein COA94_07310 [Rickettsiales bacterium]
MLLELKKRYAEKKAKKLALGGLLEFTERLSNELKILQVHGASPEKIQLFQEWMIEVYKVKATEAAGNKSYWFNNKKNITDEVLSMVSILLPLELEAAFTANLDIELASMEEQILKFFKECQEDLGLNNDYSKIFQKELHDILGVDRKLILESFREGLDLSLHKASPLPTPDWQSYLDAEFGRLCESASLYLYKPHAPEVEIGGMDIDS